MMYFSKSSDDGSDQLLLVLSLMENESNQCVDNQTEYLDWVLKVF